MKDICKNCGKKGHRTYRNFDKVPAYTVVEHTVRGRTNEFCVETPNTLKG